MSERVDQPEDHPGMPSLARPWIKICGVRTVRELDLCAAVGATHVGLNTWPASPRFVSASLAAELVAESAVRRLCPVVLVVPGSEIELDDLVRVQVPFAQVLAPPSLTQRERLRDGGIRVVEARRVTAANVRSECWGDVLLIDAHVEGTYGGTGRTVPWEVARMAPVSFVLAGGLSADNVTRAIESCSPIGVDAASGLECSPGVKDIGKVRAFCVAARQAFDRLAARMVQNGRNGGE